MAYSKRRFGAELILALENGYDIKKLSEWADGIRYKYLLELTPELKEIIENISAMSFGDEFVYTKQELINLAVKLIKEDHT